MAEYIFFSSSYGTFFRTDHILGHKLGLNKYKMTKIIPCIFSEHNAMKPEVNHKKKSAKTTNTWRSNNMLLKKEQITRTPKKKFKSTWKHMKMKTQWSKNFGMQQM